MHKKCVVEKSEGKSPLGSLILVYGRIILKLIVRK
jgi:hypothetical protein